MLQFGEKVQFKLHTTVQLSDTSNAANMILKLYSKPSRAMMNTMVLPTWSKNNRNECFFAVKAPLFQRRYDQEI